MKNTVILRIAQQLFVLLSLSLANHAWAQLASCSAPGKDGTAYSAPSYYPGNASVAAGNNTIALGVIRTATGTNVPANSGAPGTTPLSPGDLVMVIQMQDAQYNNSANTATVAYGDGATGRGFTNRNNSGSYEFRRVVSFAAGSLVVDQGLSNTYTRSAPSAGNGALENGNRRFQVIRVPQFSTLTMPAGTTSPPYWNGETGGVWVIDVAGNLNMNGAVVDASNLGFRGAGGWPNYYPATFRYTNYVNTAAFDFTPPGAAGTCVEQTIATVLNIGAAKGEGIAGTPRLVRRQSTTSNSTYDGVYAYEDLGTVGYANGGFVARGAPGNAGGGGTQHNAGGGGGSNVGQGGLGGNTFAFYFATDQGGCVQLAPTFWGCTGDGARQMGGLGGGTLPATVTYVIMGGGGGAGDNNNACDNPTIPQAAGGNGGGIIYIRAGSITNAGTLRANGQNALPGGRDAAGGGGAGGSVVVLTGTNAPALTINANGGEGGNTAYGGSGGVPVTFLRAGETQGPGAGGGGGAVIRSSNITFPTAPTFAGGIGGKVFPVQNSEATINNAYGAGSGGGAAATVPFVPTSQSIDTNCLPQLQVNKLTTTPVVVLPGNNTAQYVVSIANTGPGTAVGVTLNDILPVPFQYAPGTAPLNVIGVAYVGNAAGTANPTTGTGTGTLVVGTPGSNLLTNSYLLPPGSTVTFTVTIVVNGGGVTPTLNFPFQNSATVGYLDPLRTTATSQVSPGTAYAGTTTVAPGSNYASGSSTQEDVRVLGSVNLAITKTNGTTTLAAGSTTAYTITIANFGSFPAVSATFKDPVAAGLSCTTVTCTQFGAAVCPTPAATATTIALMQGAGIVIPNLPPTAAASPPADRVEFLVTCGVTATGQ
jgi:uncharacterized repeat protein (TIGR01451 family)